MLKNISILIFLFICFGLISIKAQSIELGFGYTPIISEGTDIHTFDGGDSSPSTNYVSQDEKSITSALNLNLGMYFSLLNRTPEFSTGVLYQWITYVGKESYGEERVAYGLDLPVMACVRVGYTANENSRSAIGASFGAGMMYSMLGLSGVSAYDSKGVFTPAFHVGLIARDVGGIEVGGSMKGYQMYYQTNTGDIPRVKYTTMHISIYGNLGTW
jgi:hypothetical protein